MVAKNCKFDQMMLGLKLYPRRIVFFACSKKRHSSDIFLIILFFSKQIFVCSLFKKLDIQKIRSAEFNIYIRVGPGTKMNQSPFEKIVLNSTGSLFKYDRN